MSDAESDDEDGILERQNWGNGSLSLKSKMEALHDTLAIDLPTPEYSPRGPISDLMSQDNNAGGRRTFSMELPPPPKLLALLQVFFQEHNAFFPCVDKSTFETRLLDWISRAGYGSGSNTVSIPTASTPLAALTCMIFAVTEFINPDVSSQYPDSGRSLRQRGRGWHQKGAYLSRHAQRSSRLDLDLDLVCFHVLQAWYFHYVDNLAEASKSVALAVALSLRGGLNDQSSFSARAPEDRLSRKALWWTLYYLDRRVAEKCGQPYYLRDAEIDVDDFSSLTSSGSMAWAGSDTRALFYLQGMITWARLWAQVWDRFFALRASSLGDAEAVAAMDALIQSATRNLPHELTWDTGSLQDYVASGEDSRDTRYRLLTYTRTNLLRIILRHNPLLDNHDDIEVMRLCGSIAIDTVHAVTAYMTTYNTVGQLGHFTASTLVECICHLIPSLATNFPQSDRDAALQAIAESQQLLSNIALHQGSAKRAQKVMNHVFDAVRRLSCPAVPPDGDLMQDPSQWPLFGLEDFDFTKQGSDLMSLPSEPFDLGEDWLLDSFFQA